MPRVKRETGQPEERVMAGFQESCRCEACKLARFEGSALGRAVVHNYSYKPRRWRMLKTRNDPHDYYLGVELETDAHRLVTKRIPEHTEQRWSPSTIDEQGNYVGHRIIDVVVKAETYVEEQYSDVVTNVACDMARPKTLWMGKMDGSITGVEFVSQPATFAYWQAKRDDIAEMFKMLLHSGYRSHDNDRCGMHINISRSAFTGAEHLYRFLSLLHNNVEWSLRMSQRTKESAKRWAGLTGVPLAQSRTRKEVCERLYRPSYYGSVATHNTYSGGARYQALNIPYGEARFEFRLPRGTLRIDRFYKNIEWTVAMIEFTRNSRLADGRGADKFMAYVEANSRTYPSLATFIQERFGV